MAIRGKEQGHVDKMEIFGKPPVETPHQHEAIVMIWQFLDPKTFPTQ